MREIKWIWRQCWSNRHALMWYITVHELEVRTADDSSVRVSVDMCCCWLSVGVSCLMQPCAAVYVIKNVTKYPVVEVRYIQVIGEISTANTLYFIFMAVVLLWPLLLGHLFQSCRKGACGVCCDGELKHRSIDHSKTVADVPCLYASMINLPPPPTPHTHPTHLPKPRICNLVVADGLPGHLEPPAAFCSVQQLLLPLTQPPQPMRLSMVSHILACLHSALLCSNGKCILRETVVLFLYCWS